MQTTLYPSHSLKPQGWDLGPKRRPTGPRATSHPGDWQYFGIARPSRLPVMSILVSAAAHAVLLLAFNHRAPAVKALPPPDTAVVQLVMPPIKDDEEKPPVELDDGAEPEQGVAVPSLVDVPTRVDISTAFVQPLQLNNLTKADLGGAKLSNIPVKIAHGPRTASGLKNVFDISQLDRIPEPIAQPAPRFPFELKNQVSQAEVIVEFIVDTDGNVRNAEVVRSSHHGFDQASVDGVSKWRFRAGMKGGRKVNSRMMVPLRFNVVDSE